MKIRQLSESQGLSYSNLVILSLYAVFLGVIVGLIDAIFGRVLIGLSEYRDHHLFYLVPALPIAGLLIVYLYQRFAGKAAQGMGLIFKVGHNEEKQVPLRLIPLVTVTTWLKGWQCNLVPQFPMLLVATLRYLMPHSSA